MVLNAWYSQRGICGPFTRLIILSASAKHESVDDINLFDDITELFGFDLTEMVQYFEYCDLS